MSDWRRLTPILLVTIIVLFGFSSYLAKNTLDTNSKSLDLNTHSIGILSASFNDYKVDNERRVSTVETNVQNIRERLALRKI